MQGRWQVIPLYATQDADKLAISDGFDAPALQAALEPAQDRADDARRQIVDLREQYADLNTKRSEVMASRGQHANLREKQDEVIALREQLADAEANSRQIVEHLRAVIEDKKRADKALLRANASHEELERLRAGVIDAQKAAESEKQKVISTLKELEAVKGQLAASLQQEAADAVQEERARRMVAEALVSEYQRATVEEKVRSDDALKKVAALLEEQEGLRASLIKARIAEARERQNATSALGQLNDVKGHLAALTLLEHGRPENTSQLQQDQMIGAVLDKRQQGLPAERVFQSPGPSEAFASSPDEQQRDVEQSERPKKKNGITKPGLKWATLDVGAKALTGSTNHKATAPARGGKSRIEAEAVSSIERKPEARSQSVRLVERPSPKAKRQPLLLGQSAHRLRSLGAPSLPSALLPDRTLW